MKNLAGPGHNTHVAKLCGLNKYYSIVQDEDSHEQGRVSESQSAHNWKNTKALGEKTWEIRVSALGIKEVKERIHGTKRTINWLTISES